MPDPTDTSIKKIDAAFSPVGELGQKYLASGIHVSMRLWENVPPGERPPEDDHPYESVGYVIKGRAELHLAGQMVLLGPGHSWSVPKGAAPVYNVLESFTAVEATAPPAQVRGRDYV